MKKIIFSVFMILSTAVSSAAMAQSADETECSEDILLVFFPSSFVKKTLQEHGVEAKKQDTISAELLTTDGEIKQRLEEKASRMDPNPLQDPSQREKAARLFHETLSEVFSNVMRKNGIDDQEEIDQMLFEIQQQRFEQFKKCRSYLEKKYR